MSMWKRAMDYLGLGPDDAYDDGFEYIDDDHDEVRPRPTQGYDESTSQRRPPESGRPVFPSRDFDTRGAEARGGDDSNVVRIGRVTRPSAEPVTVKPHRFDQAQEVADAFKAGQPVIMNLEESDREIVRRLLDFASGLCYALDGSMEKVANGVYLLKPAGSHATPDA